MLSVLGHCLLMVVPRDRVYSTERTHFISARSTSAKALLGSYKDTVSLFRGKFCFCRLLFATILAVQRVRGTGV